MIFGAHPLGPFSAYSSWLIELAVVLGVAVLFVAMGVRRTDGMIDRSLRKLAQADSRRLTAAVVVGAFIVCLGVAALVLDRFPNSADEYGDLFLAETLAQGRLWNDVPEPPEFFSVIHIAEKDGKWVARYPPGWPAIIALTGFLKFPAWALNPLIGALTLGLVGSFARRFIDTGAGLVAVVLMATSGFFVFTVASYRSHVVASFWILAGAYLMARFVEESRVGHALLAGLAFGLAFATRPYTALLCAVPFLVYLLIHRPWRQLIYVVLGGVPGVAGLLLYNYLITGNPLLLVTTWMDPSEGLGFTHGHTAVRGATHAMRRLAAFVEWTNPALLFVFCACAWRLWLDRTKGLFAWMSLVLPALVIGHFFYHAFGGTQYGPRFYYEAYPFVVLVVVNGIFNPSRETTPGSPPWWRRALAVGMVFAIITLPIAAARLHRVVEERQDVFRLVHRQNLHNAVVFIASPTGRIWPMPVQDLLRNGTSIGGDVIYAHDRGSRNHVLKETFPGRDYYRYSWDAPSNAGRLKPD